MASLRRKAPKQAAEELPDWVLSFEAWCAMADVDDPLVTGVGFANFYNWLAARRDWCADHGILDEWAPNPEGQPQLARGGGGLIGG